MTTAHGRFANGIEARNHADEETISCPEIVRPPPAKRPKPRWDAAARELWYRNVLVKRFRNPAKSQCRILTEFEEAGWPRCIDDPLPHKDGAGRWQALKKAIHGLNASQENPLIKFHGNGNGDGIWWEDVGPR